MPRPPFALKKNEVRHAALSLEADDQLTPAVGQCEFGWRVRNDETHYKKSIQMLDMINHQSSFNGWN